MAPAQSRVKPRLLSTRCVVFEVNPDEKTARETVGPQTLVRITRPSVQIREGSDQGRGHEAQAWLIRFVRDEAPEGNRVFQKA